MKPRGGAVAFVALLCLSAAPATAQTNERIYEDLDFRFVTPGARAVAMGKTFIGLGDDATAAVSNPAGLSNLLEQEFSFEFTGTQIKHQRFFPSEAGELQTFGELVLTPSFFSYVVPLRRATLAVFRNSLQNYRERYEIGDRFVPALNGTEDGTFGNIAASVESYGFGGAYVLSRYISVGGSATLVSLDLASEARSGTPLNPRNGTNTIDSDLEWSGLAGVLVKPTPSLALGFTYNKGSIFEVKTRLFGNFLFTLPGNPPRSIDVNFTGDERDINYVLPDRYSAGMSWRPSNNMTVLGDVSRVNYSQQITDKFLIADFLDPDARVSPDNFFINDVYEVHAGIEWRHYGRRTNLRPSRRRLYGSGPPAAVPERWQQPGASCRLSPELSIQYRPIQDGCRRHGRWRRDPPEPCANRCGDQLQPGRDGCGRVDGRSIALTRGTRKLRLALVSAYPPSTGPLSEYGWHLVQYLEHSERIEQVYVLADRVPGSLRPRPPRSRASSDAGRSAARLCRSPSSSRRDV